MIQLDLDLEQEQALRDQAAANGMLPEAFAAHMLERQGVLRQASPLDEATRQRRAQAVERILALREQIGPGAGPPPGLRWREWIHEEHKY